jgi:hypothetical protein
MWGTETVFTGIGPTYDLPFEDGLKAIGRGIIPFHEKSGPGKDM